MDVIASISSKMGERRSINCTQADRSGFICRISPSLARTVDRISQSRYLWKEYELVLVVGAERRDYDNGAWDEKTACE